MKPEIVDFRPEHLPDPVEGEFKAKSGPAWTAVYGEQIIASAGVLVFWNGVAEAWVSTWTRNAKLAVWFHRAIKRKLAEVVKNLKLWRVQAHVAQHDRQARKWIERLGFMPDGLKFHFGPDGSNYLGYYQIYRENLP